VTKTESRYRASDSYCMQEGAPMRRRRGEFMQEIVAEARALEARLLGAAQG
jgi:hypothetical protein